MKVYLPLLLLILSSCASTSPKAGVLAASCGPTEIRESDLEQFGFKPEPDKIVVLRVFATWCPYCKLDLAHIGEHYQSKVWSPEKIKLFLLAYRTHGESRDTVEAFQREDLKNFGIPESAVQIQFLDKDVEQVRQIKSASGALLFAGLQGLPFGMVFGKDLRLAYRGHFTTSDVDERRHYDFITSLQNESCGDVK